MPSLSASELITWWERSAGHHPVERAVTLLALWLREPREKTAGFSIGMRDRQLGAVYQSLFGPVLRAFAECPNCAERLEYQIVIPELHAEAGGTDQQEITLASGEILLHLRPPNSLDLIAIRDCTDLQSAQRTLGQRCLIEARTGHDVVAVEALAESTWDEIAARLAESDPGAETLIDLTCAACRHTWQVMLDIEYFLWTKIGALAKRLLREVHVLARAYGWSEAEILALSPVRRQFYLEMAQT
ncbi:MAG TPA: phage baseplate protein [Candidatus Angelobacter sp.]